jgi:tetratricopeptide (TPR) repeat protein
MSVLKFIFAIFFFLCISYSSNAQNNLLENTAVFQIMKQGTQKMYNYDFDGAEILFNQAMILLPKHPAPILMKGMLIYWRNLPLVASSPKVAEMQKLLLKAEELAQAMLKIDAKNPEAIFFEMTARSLMMQHYAKIGESSKALSEARHIYGNVKTGMELQDKFNEFYFSSGLYNYYREKYPEVKPFYKIVSWIFQAGDKKLGLEQLVFAGKHCVISQTQALFFLTHIYLTYEKNPFKSVEYAKELSNKFPKNRYYLCRYVETLLLTKQYDLANTHLQSLLKESSVEPFTVMISQVWAGILEEKKNKNYILAQKYYQNAIQLATTFGIAGNHYQAYAYIGLSKIAKINKQDNIAKNYWKKAEELAEYKYIFDY